MDEGVESLSVDVDVLSMDNLDGCVPSLSVDELNEGVQSLSFDEYSLLGEQVPSVDGPRAVVPNVKPNTSKQRRKWRTKVENLKIDLKGWNSIYVS